MRTLAVEVTLGAQKLDEITDAEDLVTALWKQCEEQVDTTAVRLRKGPAETQVV